ncbi:hypothetical protein [Burkholderia diffusa]|uniref:hypothetical protein n=1 Tax=Burkholderia diffusa TaxID=488732 RepID=UPI0012D9023A|nr:hypothetical protein [Burkholderia diffusa]
MKVVPTGHAVLIPVDPIPPLPDLVPGSTGPIIDALMIDNGQSDSIDTSGNRFDMRNAKARVNQAVSFLHEGGHFEALAAMGEGLVLKATPDPNPKAGNNIGFGYNLNANELTIKNDFIRSGIPVDKINEIKSGEFKITRQQAENLLRVVKPRYELLAKKAVDSVKPGLWDKLSDGQRAALTDVTYQTGDLGQFKNALGMLASGDSRGFRDGLRVTYVNAKGGRVEDTRRNMLRSLMSAGPHVFIRGIGSDEAYSTSTNNHGRVVEGER